jgi:pimeloyl-ACP methyl ester carboxylesterase
MKTLKKIGIGTFMLFCLLGIVYALGPEVEYAKDYDSIVSPMNIPLDQLDSVIQKRESKIEGLKADNEARIIWADSSKQKTPFSLVYLHGFSASQEEGDPIHEDFAKRYGCNLFLSRLADHGRFTKNSFIDLTPAQLINSAKEAIAYGQLLGEKVIVMSCSTGSTLSIYLSSNPDNNIAGQIMYSPNIDIFDPMSELLLYPWAEQLMLWVTGGEYRHVAYGPLPPKYWNEDYHINGAIAVKHLIDQTMNEEVFKNIKQPLFLGYYYKNEEEQDKVVSIERMKEFASQVGTPEDEKRVLSFPNVGAHVMASYVFSKDLEQVANETYAFAEEVLKLVPVNMDY